MLTPEDLAYMRTCLDEAATAVEEAITYKQYTGATPGNPIMGTPDTSNYNDLMIMANIRELTLEEVKVSGGVYVLGDVEFKLRQAALAQQPAYPDRIQFAGMTYKPKSISHSYLGGLISWTIRAGKE